MTVHNIPLETLAAHGSISHRISSGVLSFTAAETINTLFSRSDSPIQSYLIVPGKYKLPFHVDMTVKIDSPALYLIVGKGHVAIGTDGMDNRSVTSIVGGELKPRKHRADNAVLVGQFVRVSAVYGRKAMQLVINGESRYLSRKDAYMHSPLLATDFAGGFEVKLACEKLTQVELSAFTITEYGDDEPEFLPDSGREPLPPCLSLAEKPTLKDCIQGLRPELRLAILETDRYLLETLKKTMKFRRKIEGGFPISKITYVSPLGFSYKLNVSGHVMAHSMGWIDYNTKREQERHCGVKKADHTVETLLRLAEDSPDFARFIYSRMKECAGCYGGFCLHRSEYEFDGVRKTSCGGALQFKMLPAEFDTVRNVIGAISEVIQAGTKAKE